MDECFQKAAGSSVNAHHQPREVSGALHCEGADEDVQDCCGEDGESRHVVQVVQTVLQGAVIQVPTACEIHTCTTEGLPSFQGCRMKRERCRFPLPLHVK